MPSRLTALLLAAVFAVTAPAQSPQPKLLVRDALLFTMAPGQYKPFVGYLTVAPDGTILTVAPGNPPATLHAQQTLDAHGHWIIPGFISAHSHLWQAAFRGLAADSTLTGWLTAVYNDSGNKSRPEDLYWFTLSTARSTTSSTALPASTASTTVATASAHPRLPTSPRPATATPSGPRWTLAYASFTVMT